MFKVEFSPEAINDLQQIKNYITNELCNEQAAVSTLNKIINHIHILENFPESGAMLSSIVNIDINYRFLVCGNYTAFYRVDSETVYIVRVIYGRRDFIRILFGKPYNEN